MDKQILLVDMVAGFWEANSATISDANPVSRRIAANADNMPQYREHGR